MKFKKSFNTVFFVTYFIMIHYALGTYIGSNHKDRFEQGSAEMYIFRIISGLITFLFAYVAIFVMYATFYVLVYIPFRFISNFYSSQKI